MSPDQIINNLDELEAMAAVMEDNLTRLKKNCRRAREILAEVSTSATPSANHLAQVGADAVARRRARLNKKHSSN